MFTNFRQYWFWPRNFEQMISNIQMRFSLNLKVFKIHPFSKRILRLRDVSIAVTFSRKFQSTGIFRSALNKQLASAVLPCFRCPLLRQK